MKKGIVIIWTLCMTLTSAAQVYQTQAGTILVSGIYKGVNVSAISNQLFMHLNYENAQMQLRMMIGSLITENDSLSELLNKLSGQELTFNGKMNIAFVQTKSHPKQKFKIEGMMFINGISKPFSFNSTLQHFPIRNTSCILSGQFIINLRQFNFNNLPPGEEKITVKFTQLVLKKSGD